MDTYLNQLLMVKQKIDSEIAAFRSFLDRHGGHNDGFFCCIPDEIVLHITSFIPIGYGRGLYTSCTRMHNISSTDYASRSNNANNSLVRFINSNCFAITEYVINIKMLSISLMYLNEYIFNMMISEYIDNNDECESRLLFEEDPMALHITTEDRVLDITSGSINYEVTNAYGYIITGAKYILCHYKNKIELIHRSLCNVMDIKNGIVSNNYSIIISKYTCEMYNGYYYPITDRKSSRLFWKLLHDNMLPYPKDRDGVITRIENIYIKSRTHKN